MNTYRNSNDMRDEIIGKVADVLREERAKATDIEAAVDKAGADRDKVNLIFGSMHGLVLEMVSDLSDELIEPLGRHGGERTVRIVLIEFGTQLANAYSASHLIALYRIALTEATRHVGIGKEFFDRGPGRLTTCLAEYFQHSGPSSGLRLENPKLIADNFLSLLRDNLELSDAMAADKSSSASDHNEVVTEAVELFCRGILKEGR